jgi:uncharacterized membrane protein YeaQ/YmgE (transglycosylase-associated protein family)
MRKRGHGGAAKWKAGWILQGRTSRFKGQNLEVTDFEEDDTMSGIIWIIIVGFIAGIIARVLSPGANNPSGFILTTVLGIAGAFLATFIGQTIGHYGPDQGAGFITATIGALVVLFIWNRLVAARVISDPGNK